MGFIKRILDIDDVLTIIGIALIGAGIWFIYWPASLITMGLLSFSIGILGSRLRRLHGKNS